MKSIFLLCLAMMGLTTTARADLPAPLTTEQRINHTLNRLSFGPSAEELERVREMGIERWLDEQLNPDDINDLAVDKQVGALSYLLLPRWRLMAVYAYDQRPPKRDNSLLYGVTELKHPAELVSALADNRNPLARYLYSLMDSTTRAALDKYKTGSDPSGALQQMIVNELNALLRGECIYTRFQREASKAASGFGRGTVSKATLAWINKGPQGDDLVRLNRQLFEEAYPGQFVKLSERIEGMGPMMMAEKPDIFEALRNEELKGGMRPETNYMISAMARGQSERVVQQMIADKMLRAVQSRKQLQEVLVDFWSNHFNVDVHKGAVRVLKIVDDREVIRPHALGKFRDLLGASAKSPAMLLYLDNVQSTSEYEMPANQPGYQAPSMVPEGLSPDTMFASATTVDTVKPAKPNVQAVSEPAAMEYSMMMSGDKKESRRKIGGLNENYARELMELHTLGVDGGYTQKDVQEVARCFTGWGCTGTGKFAFNPRLHDAGPKVVLGHQIPAGGGINDGEMVLDILASHPATAHFIATKLCKRFVADEPPATLVATVEKAFLDSGGDMRIVMKAIAAAPEFYDPHYYRAKIKSPFEYAISAARAVGSEYRAEGVWRSELNQRSRKSLSQYIAEMGQPLFAHLTPDGYPENSKKWISSGMLVARLNFAVAISNDMVAEVRTLPAALLDSAAETDKNTVLAHLGAHVVGGDLTPGTRAALGRVATTNGQATTARLLAVLFGTPEFQRH